MKVALVSAPGGAGGGPPAPQQQQRLRALRARTARAALLAAVLLLMTGAELARQRAFKASPSPNDAAAASGAGASIALSFARGRFGGGGSGGGGDSDGSGSSSGGVPGAYKAALAPVITQIARLNDSQLSALAEGLQAAAGVSVEEARRVYTSALSRLEW